jgi:hypothetical protein
VLFAYRDRNELGEQIAEQKQYQQDKTEYNGIEISLVLADYLLENGDIENIHRCKKCNSGSKQ